MTSDSLESSAVEQDKYRLPTNVKPAHYDLTFWTDLKALEFGGFINVESVLTNLRRIAVDVKQSLRRVLTKGGKKQAKLEIHYNAKLRASLNGYYKSAWKNDGKTEYYALTQFEPTDARAAFPCYDEPGLKATWTITMISRSETVNISNMPAESEVVYNARSVTLDGNLAALMSRLSKDVQWKITKFQKTPPMSSYLVAFANGPFAHLETKIVMPLSGKTVPLRVYTTPDMVHQAGFCLDVTAKVLPLYETIFDIEYPLPKLDTLAVNDFDLVRNLISYQAPWRWASALIPVEVAWLKYPRQNWGLITGRANCFLIDPDKADIASRQWIASVQSHEVAHMWFGNITTMEWWDYLYLNEGFATLASCSVYLLVMMGEAIVLNNHDADIDRVFPEWEVNSKFVSKHLNRALILDAKQSSHPVEVKCPDANFINQIFDGLSYSKAASGKDITRIMNNWIVKIGFPLITVTETPNGIRVRQDRYLSSGPPEADDNETIWLKLMVYILSRNVPLGILTVNEDGRVHVDNTAILEEREKTLTIDINKPFKLNAGTTGLYRVLYTSERLSKIATEAAKEDSVFSLSDRIGIIYDVSQLAKAGLTKLSSLLTLVDIWRNETNHLVWGSILTGLSGALSAFGHDLQIDANLRAFIRTLFVPLVQRLGYDDTEDDSVDIIQLRKTAIRGASEGRDERHVSVSCTYIVQELQSRFADYMKTGNDTKIPSNIKPTIFATAARFGGQEEFEALVDIIENSNVPADKPEAIHAIGCTQDLSLVDKVFSYILIKARDQDVPTFFLGLESNPISRPLLAQFFKDNYETFSQRFAANSMLKNLVSDKDTTRFNMALAQALETIRDRIAYIEYINFCTPRLHTVHTRQYYFANFLKRWTLYNLTMFVVSLRSALRPMVKTFCIKLFNVNLSCDVRNVPDGVWLEARGSSRESNEVFHLYRIQIMLNSSPLELLVFQAVSNKFQRIISQNPRCWSQARNNMDPPVPPPPQVDAAGVWSGSAYAQFIFGGGECVVKSCKCWTPRFPCSFALRIRVCSANNSYLTSCAIPGRRGLREMGQTQRLHFRDWLVYDERDMTRMVLREGDHGEAIGSSSSSCNPDRRRASRDAELFEEYRLRAEALPRIMQNAKALQAWSKEFAEARKSVNVINVAFIKEVISPREQMPYRKLLRTPILSNLMKSYGRSLSKLDIRGTL
ncbi:peptidase family M1-domain-containing protein [Mycena vitilis]|nr:peptidase family M1-domain-containing protein [Mycena vitilis]